METKLQVLVRAARQISAAGFGERVLREIAPRVLDCSEGDIKLTITDVEPPRVSVIPFRRDRAALFSLWGDADPGALAAAVAGDGLESWSYRVEESVPRAYERDWPAGETTPGLGLLTVFNRKPGLDDATFIERWHHGHTPLTLELHPVWCYVRNVVREAFDGTPHRDAIVEEHFRASEELLKPSVFFGGPLAMVPNMMRVWVDIRRFIDLGTLESYLTREHWLRG